MEIFSPLVVKSLIGIIVIIVPVLIISQISKNKAANQKIEWFSRMRFVVLRILVPRNNEKTPLAAEQMFSAIHGIYDESLPYQEYISFEIAARDKYIYFYVCTPSHLKDFVQGQIYAQYPTAEINEVNDYTQDEVEHIRSGQTKIAGTEMSLVNSDVFPIKSFLNFEVDPLSSVTSVLSKIERDEQIWIQIMVKPVPDEWQKKGMKHIKLAKSGNLKQTSFMESFWSVFLRMLSAIFATIFSGTTPESERGAKKEEAKLSGNEDAALKGIEAKVTKLGFGTKIRLLALAPNETTAKSKINELVGAFKQFNLIHMNGFKAGALDTTPKIWEDFSHRLFLDEGYILNTEEVASIYHLPSITVVTPNLVWAGSKKGEPPANLPIEENIDSDDLTIFGQADFRHLKHKFGIKIPDRRYHMYVIGKTGTGKSTLLENMAIDDIREGRGIAVVDPHGDLINHIIEYIPEERIKDVVIFSPADKMFPVAFNPLENVDPDLKNIIASGVVGIFKKIFGESWGPRLEYILRNTILALLDVPNSTLLGITRLLVDKSFRDKVVPQITDPVIKDFFVNEFEQYDPKFRTEAIAPIQNKVGQFLSSSTIRNIIGQPISSINVQEIMDTGKIFLVNLSVGEIGEDASSLLGSLMITKIQLTAMRRASVKEEDRRDFYLYVDEFQNFATESFATILSEARKYHLNLIMAHQYVAQMLEPVRDAVVGNVGTMISFRIGAPDADFLQNEFAPNFEAIDLVNLDNYHVYVKMSIDGVTCPAFSALTLPRNAMKFNNREKIIEFSRSTYSHNRDYVEAQIGQISDLPKLEEIMTKQQKKLVPKLPPKIGETYYREIQNPGDVRWYMGGGTEDMPLTEETVQAKVEKTEEKAEIYEEKLEEWQKERMVALDPNFGKTDVVQAPVADNTVTSPVATPISNMANSSFAQTEIPKPIISTPVVQTPISVPEPAPMPVSMPAVVQSFIQPNTILAHDQMPVVENPVMPNPVAMPAPQPVPEPVIVPTPVVTLPTEMDDDKASILSSMGTTSTQNAQALEDGQVVNIHSQNQ
jgi:hypothetical protein